ncbi:glycosyltransferase family 4 protein [Marinobacter qingdaonensis]|uniref:Glycosyltransferase family 4 protein n=1 Tax=Marinobacter qingdaonensis TaxID=3108486 RepID=A0ABU5P064_9GAMM|nr:glycosyltransferase family 4 protein [Marinobacter sp. ASW11-75]MEA1081434.1 glycosyltransferase family 4 protein [Marinobacter sp. ASW11-75]
MIVLLSYDYPPNDGGISRLVAELTKGLLKLGQEVKVVTVEDNGRAGPLRPEVTTAEVASRGWMRHLATLRSIQSVPSEAKLIASVWNPEGTLAWIAGRSSNLWIMAHGNEVMPYPSGLRFGLKKWLRGRVLAAAKGVICNSRYTEGLVKVACPSARTVVIPLGVDVSRFSCSTEKASAREQFGLPERGRIVLSVSRLNSYKGHDTVLRALASLPAAEREELHYVVAGKGEHLSALKALAKELEISGQVHWLGFVGEADLPLLYRSADLFVLCTREDSRGRGVEGFGLVFLEAQAAGIPVLGTRAGGIPDAIKEGRGGWLVQPDDIEALRNKLSELASGHEKFEMQGIEARRRAESECTWDVYVDKFCEILELQPGTVGATAASNLGVLKDV